VPDHGRRQQRLIALHVDDQGIVRPPSLGGHFHDAVGTRGMVDPSQRGGIPGTFDRPGHTLVIRCDDHLAGTGRQRLLHDTDDHGSSTDLGERLSGQARRCETRRYHDLE
jgi:hypothetical protein